MSTDGFDLKILSEKLSKLNNSQQSIESLSRWCVSNRKKARQIVETWKKLFNSSSKEQCVSFLYLANDILQTSRRKGSEFVNEFLKVLPSALKHVYDNGDESGKKAATRLVDIWEERKVFGSRVKSLKDELVSIQTKDLSPQLVSNGKTVTVNPIKIVKKDAQSLRIKLAVGGFPERILSAFHSFHDECSNEESILTKCNAAALSVERIVKEVEKATSQGTQPGAGVADEMQEQENVLQQCVRQLECAESSRAYLVSLLNEAVKDQELHLETLRSQLQIARNRINEMGILKPKLSSHDHNVSVNQIPASTAPHVGELNNLILQATSLQIPPSLTPPIGSNQQIPPVHQVSPKPTSFATLTPATDEESTKAAAAAVAAKLAASTNSAQMFASVLSSLVAEETASMNDSLRKVGISSSLPIFSPEKRQKVEQPPAHTDPANLEGGRSPFFTPLQQPISNNQVSQSGVQASLGPPPPPPPPPPSLLPMNPNQFSQSTGMMMNMIPPYGFSGGSLPPPPPLPSHVAMGLARPLVIPQNPQPLQPPQQLGQQHNASAGFYRPPGVGVGLYGSTSQPSTPPVNRP